jgi:hypothetical protein
MVLMEQARFEEALAVLETSSTRLRPGDRQRDWVLQQARLCRRQRDLNARLPAVLRGDEKPAGAAEQIEFGQLCARKGLHAAAARFYRDALAVAGPRAEDVPPAGTRYRAACAAALAGCGAGEDAGRLGDPERARWRRQALDWLRLDLAGWGRSLARGKQQAARVRQEMRRWQDDADLAGAREREALAALPPEERAEWEQLWAEVADLLRRLDTKAAAPAGK